MDKSETKAEDLALYLDLTPQRIHQLVKEGVVFKRARGDFKFDESVQGYIKYLKAALDGKESERGPKYEEEVRKLKRENDLEEGFVEHLSDIEAVYTPIYSRISQVIDRLPDIATDACPAVDGRGREKMAEALIVEKNELARAHERLFPQGN